MEKLYFTVAELAERWKLTKYDVAILGAEGRIQFGVFVDHANIDFERIGSNFGFTDARVCSFTISGYVPVESASVAEWMVKRPGISIGIDRGRIYQALKDAGHFKSGPNESELIDGRTSVVFGQSIYDEGLEHGLSFNIVAKAADVIAYEKGMRDVADESKALRVLGALLSYLVKDGKKKQSGMVTDLAGMKINGLGKTTIDTVFASANRAFKALE